MADELDKGFKLTVFHEGTCSGKSINASSAVCCFFSEGSCWTSRAADLYEHPASKNLTVRVKFNVITENIKAKIQERGHPVCLTVLNFGANSWRLTTHSQTTNSEGFHLYLALCLWGGITEPSLSQVCPKIHCY